MTYQFPPVDEFREMLRLLTEEDKRDIRKSYEQDVLEYTKNDCNRLNGDLWYNGTVKIDSTDNIKYFEVYNE